MSTLTTINANDYQDDSRSDINDNFSALNNDKAEISGQVFTGPISFSGTTNAGLKVNSLTTVQRDALTPANGMVIYNSTTNLFEVYENGAWTYNTSVQYVALTYGETIAVNDAVYLKASDGYVYKCDADDVTTLNFIGFAKTAGNLGTSGAVQVIGVVSGLSSLTIGGVYYLSGTPGAITTTAPTNSIIVGQALTATTLLIDKGMSKITRYYTTPGTATWTKPSGLKYIEVEVVSGGGGTAGSNGSGTCTSGAGGGGYGKKIIVAASLGATETVTVGAGGGGAAWNGTPTSGGLSSFGSHVSVTGGERGRLYSETGVTAGGVSTGGDINITGEIGMSNTFTSATGMGGKGGNSILGFGGPSHIGDVDGIGGMGYGGGASGSSRSTNGTNFGGAGTGGVVIITEYF